MRKCFVAIYSIHCLKILNEHKNSAITFIYLYVVLLFYFVVIVVFNCTFCLLCCHFVFSLLF